MNENLKTARSEKRLTQGEIAAALNVSIPTVYKWEHGRCTVARKHWKQLSSMLDIGVEQLELILVQTLLETCMKKRDKSPLRTAIESNAYNITLLQHAEFEFDQTNAAPAQSNSLSEEQKLEYKQAIFERDKQIFDLEKKVFELEKELERLRREIDRIRPRPSSSSESTITNKQLESEVKQ